MWPVLSTEVVSGVKLFYNRLSLTQTVPYLQLRISPDISLNIAGFGNFILKLSGTTDHIDCRPFIM